MTFAFLTIKQSQLGRNGMVYSQPTFQQATHWKTPITGKTLDCPDSCSTLVKKTLWFKGSLIKIIHDVALLPYELIKSGKVTISIIDISIYQLVFYNLPLFVDFE